MRRGVYTTGALACLLMLSGCDLLSPQTVTVVLENHADFGVEETLFFDGQQEIPEFLLKETGTELERIVGAGQTFTFTESCDDLQAIFIDDADLLIVGGFGPEDSTDVLRDSDEFSCGNEIRFTFSHSAAITDFDITTSVQ